MTVDMHEEGERSGEEMCEADPTFIRACQEYSEKGFSPTLTKEQLKATILLRRVSAGEEEPKIDDEKPEVKHPVRTFVKYEVTVKGTVQWESVVDPGGGAGKKGGSKGPYPSMICFTNIEVIS